MQRTMSELATEVEAPSHRLVAALQDVATEINQYLSEWRHRQQDAEESWLENPINDESLRRKILQFEQEKRQWQAELTAEQERLDEQARQLTEAWLRLEAEQLAATSRPPESAGWHPVAECGGDPELPVAAAMVSQAVEESTRPQPTPCELAGDRVAPTSLSGSPVSRPPGIIPRQVALRQFERLRSELIPAERKVRRS